jgi:hypothetical protein
VPAGPDRAAVAGVERLNRIGGEQDPADLDVVEPVAKWRAGLTPGRLRECVQAPAGLATEGRASLRLVR